MLQLNVRLYVTLSMKQKYVYSVHNQRRMFMRAGTTQSCHKAVVPQAAPFHG